MSDFEIISLVVCIGTLVIAAVAVRITIGKNNHHKLPFSGENLRNLNLTQRLVNHSLAGPLV